MSVTKLPHNQPSRVLFLLEMLDKLPVEPLRHRTAEDCLYSLADGGVQVNIHFFCAPFSFSFPIHDKATLQTVRRAVERNLASHVYRCAYLYRDTEELERACMKRLVTAQEREREGKVRQPDGISPEELAGCEATARDNVLNERRRLKEEALAGWDGELFFECLSRELAGGEKRETARVRNV